jgi:hypothetical protein
MTGKRPEEGVMPTGNKQSGMGKGGKAVVRLSAGRHDNGKQRDTLLHIHAPDGDQPVQKHGWLLKQEAGIDA